MAGWGAVFLASLLAGDSSVLVFWVVPLLLGQPFLRLYLLAEHTGCPTVSNMLQNSRTTETTAALRWLAWNMPFHAEHHACPAIPFHALPRAHELLGDHLGVRARGYVEFTRDLWTQRPGL